MAPHHGWARPDGSGEGTRARWPNLQPPRGWGSAGPRSVARSSPHRSAYGRRSFGATSRRGCTVTRQGPRLARRRRSLRGIGQLAPTGASAVTRDRRRSRPVGGRVDLSPAAFARLGYRPTPAPIGRLPRKTRSSTGGSWTPARPLVCAPKCGRPSENAREKSGNGVISMRFDSSSLVDRWWRSSPTGPPSSRFRMTRAIQFPTEAFTKPCSQGSSQCRNAWATARREVES